MGPNPFSTAAAARSTQLPTTAGPAWDDRTVGTGLDGSWPPRADEEPIDLYQDGSGSATNWACVVPAGGAASPDAASMAAAFEPPVAAAAADQGAAGRSGPAGASELHVGGAARYRG